MNQGDAELQKDIEDLKRTAQEEEEERARLAASSNELRMELKSKAEDAKAIQQDHDKAQKAYEQIKRQKTTDDEQRRQLGLQRAALKGDVETVLREIDRIRKQ